MPETSKPNPAKPADSPKSGDTPQDRLAKLLPGDVTAAFLSAKVALVSVAAENSPTYIFWTFIAIFLLCPFYFWFVTRAKSYFHVTFLTLSFAVFAISIADTEFAAYLKDIIAPPAIKAVAIVLPILWTYLVTQISVAALTYEQPAERPTPKSATPPANRVQPPRAQHSGASADRASK